MMEAYSPRREDGDSPVHLHSPHRLRCYDSHPALGEIQRSLSRSPSKPSEYRQNSLRSISPAFGAAPFHSSPLSPSRKSTSDFFLNVSAANSPFVNRNTPRLNRPGMRRTAQTTGALRTRTSPKSPSKRVLTDSSDSGNASPMPVRKRSSTEADREQKLRVDEMNVDKENSTGDENLGTRHVYTRQEKRRSGGSLMNFLPPNSPMKRPEAPMAMDQDEFQSPSAKRRSLHGPGLDFSIFESDSLSASLHEKQSQDDNDWLRQGSPAPSSRFSTIPKRSSSLRKSTVQQRQNERFSQLKFNQPLDMESSWLDATPAAKNNKGLRMSLDNHIDPLPRDSPFSAQGNLLSASIHPASSVHHTQASQMQQTRHPLSRTMTQSSSTSSVQDDSPTHEPVHRPARPRSHDFSKSLPIGASRPSPAETGSEFSSQGSFATPGNYKSAKPLPAAFMSTGLISKKNRNVEDPNGGLPKAHMPDTPCKKQPTIFPPAANFNPRKSLISHTSRQSFGTPASPAVDSNSGFSKPAVYPFSKSVGLFGPRPARPSLMRKASFASIDSIEKASSQSPTHGAGSRSTEGDFPPTPTKHTEEQYRKTSISPSPHHNRNVSVPQFTAMPGSGTHFPSSKLSPIQASPESNDGDSDSVMEDSPSANLRPKKSLLNVVAMPGSSFTQGRVLKNLSSPTALSRKALAVPAVKSPAMERAKMKTSPVTPLTEKPDRYSPRTPLDSCFPPDPSNLSISGHGERPQTRQGNAQYIPATPTGPREYFPNFSNRPSLSLNSATLENVDDSLTSRFEKVELVGTGEFSQVYRVSQPPIASPYHKIYSVSSPRPSSRAVPARVWAVKKSRYRYTGPKDRQRKLQEVNVLKALGRADHVITFVDSWEHEGHLYIQTEFCEEGTLDVFLAQMGRKARLDDFRIWKILLELSTVSFLRSSQGHLLIFLPGLEAHPRIWIHSSRSQASKRAHYFRGDSQDRGLRYGS